MSHMTRISWIAAAFAVALLAPVGYAQERSAAGAIDTQVTWSALSAKVEAANTKSDAVNTRVNQLVLCGKRGMVYAPGPDTEADGGCKAATTPDPSKLDLKTYTQTFCSRNDGPFNVVASCKPGEVLLACSGGPGDQDEANEYWILEPDYVNKQCNGRVKKPRCWTPNPTGDAYYSQVIVTATCYKP